jgi:hypothetical protein
MLFRLLKSFRLRRRTPSPEAPSAPSPSPPPSAAVPPRSRPPAAGQGVSQLQLLSRLASFASGQELAVTGKEAPASVDNGARAELPVMQIVERAAALVGDAMTPATAARAADYAQAFARRARPGSGLNVLLYHADLPPGQTIDYVDAKFSPREFDYLDILRICIERIRRHCAGATVYLATGMGSRYSTLEAPDVVPVELPLAAGQPMYERATALLGYTSSAAFARDTAFLDSDAFVNRPLEAVFQLGFDVGLTYREGSRLMPVNEGVIFLSARRPEAVRAFLARRLATYDGLLDDALVRSYYGDVRRWRGGQLSLNAIVRHLMPCSPYRAWRVGGAAVRFLPCDTYNYAAGEGEAASGVERLDDRYVVHFKGSRKFALTLAARARRPAPGR